MTTIRSNRLRRRLVASVTAISLATLAAGAASGVELEELVPGQAIESAGPGLAIAESAQQLRLLVLGELTGDTGADSEGLDAEASGDVTDARTAAEQVAEAAERVAANVAGTPAEGVADAAVAEAAERVATNVENAIANAEAGQAGGAGQRGPDGVGNAPGE